MYMTLWSLQVAHLPISNSPQLGHMKMVLLPLMSLRPHDVHIFSSDNRQTSLSEFRQSPRRI